MKIFLHLIILFVTIVSIAYSSERIDTPKIIVIDPGFGGNDKGAASCKNNIYSKDINLEISKKLKKKIEDELSIKVLTTRDNDSALSLERRVTFANIKNADLLISIQTNASTDPSVYGIETYYLDLSRDPKSIEILEGKNATSQKNIEDLDSILSALMKNTKIEESKLLAQQIQSSLCNHLKNKYKNIKNRGVKRAPFYVLLGAQMPSVMIQSSFITNKKECDRLLSDTYQNDICDGIIKGLKSFIKVNSSHNN